MHNEMKIGDTVYLKSGGEQMTIMSFDQVDGTLFSSMKVKVAQCAWFKSDGKVESAYFPLETLVNSSEVS